MLVDYAAAGGQREAALWGASEVGNSSCRESDRAKEIRGSWLPNDSRGWDATKTGSRPRPASGPASPFPFLAFDQTQNFISRPPTSDSRRRTPETTHDDPKRLLALTQADVRPSAYQIFTPFLPSQRKGLSQIPSRRRSRFAIANLLGVGYLWLLPLSFRPEWKDSA